MSDKSKDKTQKKDGIDMDLFIANLKRGLWSGLGAAALSFFLDSGAGTQAAILGFNMPAPVAIGAAVTVSSAIADIILTETDVASSKEVQRLGTYTVPVFTGAASIATGLGLGLITTSNMQGVLTMGAIGAVGRIIGERVEIMVEGQSTTGGPPKTGSALAGTNK